MSMNDKSYCGTKCDQKDCDRNLEYNTPYTKYFSVTNFDTENENHKNCKYKIPGNRSFKI